MSKNKSTLLKDALILFAISVVLALALGFTYEITKEPIARQQAEKKNAAYRSVMAELETALAVEELTAATAEYKNENGITIDEALVAVDKNGDEIGFVFTITTPNGYGGDITIAMGCSFHGMVSGIEFLTLKETAGLGMKAKEDSFKSQFSMKQTDSFAVYKNGNPVTEGNARVDAISSATVTTKAVTEAVNAGIEFAESYMAGIKTVTITCFTQEPADNGTGGQTK